MEGASHGRGKKSKAQKKESAVVAVAAEDPASKNFAADAAAVFKALASRTLVPVDQGKVKQFNESVGVQVRVHPAPIATDDHSLRLSVATMKALRLHSGSLVILTCEPEGGSSDLATMIMGVLPSHHVSSFEIGVSMEVLYRIKGPARIARSRLALRDAVAVQLSFSKEGRKQKTLGLNWSTAASLQHIKAQVVGRVVLKSGAVSVTLQGRPLQLQHVVNSPEGEGAFRITESTSMAAMLPDDDSVSSPVGVSVEVVKQSVSELAPRALQAQENALREFISTALAPQYLLSLGLTPGHGVLLYGAPGTGKTLLARHVCHTTPAFRAVLHIGPLTLAQWHKEASSSECSMSPSEVVE
eukprot:RCo037605